MTFEYKITPKTDNEILAKMILDNLGLDVVVSRNPLDGKIQIQSEKELSEADFENIKALLAEVGI